jgi:hypothetical protein
MRSGENAIGGARRDRTDDLLLAKQALSQLSYGPVLRQCAFGCDGEMLDQGVLSANERRGSTFFISKSGFVDCYTHIKNRTEVIQRNHHMANPGNK